MLFCKSENKKKRHPALVLVIGGLSAIGVCAIVTAGKTLCCDKVNAAARWMKKKFAKMPEPPASAEA